MPTRQDQLHSYQFTIQRVVAALVQRETNPANSPLRRAAGTTLAGILVAAIAIGAVAGYGLLTGAGSTGWRDGSALIVERESGARYVYRDGVLHPVLNQASALLILGAAKPRTVLAGRRALSAAARGATLGIPGAPDPLPPAARLLGAPWSICSIPATRPSSTRPSSTRPSANQPSANQPEPALPRSALLIGREPAGTPLAGRGLLVRDPAGTGYLLLNGRRHRVAAPAVLAALGWAGRPAAAVAVALINALPAGAPLSFPAIPGRGERAGTLPDATVGEVFVVVNQGGARQYAVATRAGLADATQVQADLLLADPASRRAIGQSGPTPLSPGEFTTLPRNTALDTGDLPATTPELAGSDGALCAAVADETAPPAVRVDVALPDLTTAARTAAATADGAILADHILVPPGRGALVEAAPAPGAAGTLSVITDLGRRHPLPGREVQNTIGYPDARALRMPTSLVTLLPAGPPLDPAAARGVSG